MKSNSTARPVAAGSGLSYTQKISLAAGSLSALYLLPTGAQAGIVHISGSPVSRGRAMMSGASGVYRLPSSSGFATIACPT